MRYWKRAVKLLALFLALLLLVLFLQGFVFRDFWQQGQGSLRILGFYREPRDSLDVVLIGDSTVYAGYSPILAYERRGFTSYNLAIGANVCTTWRPLTEEILREQDPQLIVVDIGGIQYDSLQEKFDSSSTIHVMLDNMPLSVNRLRSIRELTERYGDDPLEYLLPFIRYHNEWAGFGELWEHFYEMYRWRFVSGNVLKGTVARTSVEQPLREGTLDVREDASTCDLAPESEEVLREYLAYCRENDVPVLFISVPCRIVEGDESQKVFQRENRAGEIVREYGFDFVNFHYLTDGIGLDMERDFYNDAHLNYRGQIKFTEYFADLLAEEYGVTGAGGSPAWDESVTYIHRFYDYARALEEQGTDDLLTERAEVMDALDAMGEE